MIPNPARRRLDRELKLARAREGAVRSALARLSKDDARRGKLEAELADVLADQEHLIALRPRTPVRAAIDDTELAGKLVRHVGLTKTAFDTIRVACANAEADLAYELAPHLRKPGEAKRLLATLFAAPGSVKVAKRQVDVVLQPAGTRSEREAFSVLCDTVNTWNLTLPGDGTERQLFFHVQID